MAKIALFPSHYDRNKLFTFPTYWDTNLTEWVTNMTSLSTYEWINFWGAVSGR
jgi:hypothetical protein